MKKFDSYNIHIEQSTLDKLNEAHQLLVDLKGEHRSFDYIISKSIGYYLTQNKYRNKIKNTL